VLVNTGSTLIQVASDEERGGGLMGQRTWGTKGAIFRSISRLACCKWNHEALSLHKFQQFVTSLQKNCNRKWKFATGNRN